MIEVHHLAVSAGEFSLSGISFELPEGKYGVLMGPTGCGKTTLMEALCGLNLPVGGTVKLLGRDVTRLAPGARGIGYVPQDGALFPTMTVREQIAFLARWCRGGTGRGRGSGWRSWRRGWGSAIFWGGGRRG